MNPKERTRGLPVIEHGTLKKPHCGSLVMGGTRNVMVRGWVRWREPFAKVLTQLVPYKDA